MSRPAPVFAWILACTVSALAQPSASSRLPDAAVRFARADGFDLYLDLYFPPALKDSAARDTARVPLILWLHGGGWRGGSRSETCPALPLVDSGYAVASVDYRLSQQSLWPGQIHDAKAALRWLAARADSLRLDTARFAVWGTSAGGHLASLLALTVPADGLEGRVGPDTSAFPAGVRPKAAVVYHAPADFLEYFPPRWKKGSSASQLLGCTVPECPVRARAASPAAYVTTDDPPFFLAHGTDDSTVPWSQAARLDAALRGKGVPSEFVTLRGGGHGGPAFVSPEMIGRVRHFLERAFGNVPSPSVLSASSDTSDTADPIDPALPRP